MSKVKNSEEEKAEAVKRYLNGEHVKILCYDYKVSPQTIYNWRDKAKLASVITKPLLQVGKFEGDVMKLQKKVVPESEIKPVNHEGITPDKKYFTQSIPLAAVFTIKGFEFIEVADGETGRKVFVFKFDSRIEGIIREYFANTLLVPAHRYNGEIYRFKQLAMGGN